MNLSSPINSVPYIGDAYKKKLQRIGIETVKDLIFHFPTKYEDFSKTIKISQIKINESCTVRGRVVKIENKRIFKRKMVLTQGTIEDETGTISVVWFNQPYLLNSITENDCFLFSGKAGLRSKKFSLINPVVEKFDSSKKSVHTGRLVPVYPETRGLTSRWLRFIIKNLLERTEKEFPEILPDKILKEFQFLSKKEALNEIHFPSSSKQAEKAKKRIAFEQLFLIQLAVLEEKIRISKEKAVSIPINVDAAKKLADSLPFKMTDAQRKSAWRILKDMEKTYPMNRLLEGDVGSGKTVVAAMAIANTKKAGFQSALMAPTEILAKQHFKEISKTLSGFNMNIGLLTGKEDKYYSRKLKNDPIEISRKKLIEKSKSGEIDLLIGTHTLIQDSVKFKDLALVVLDEQHRFGIKQRAKLVDRTPGKEARIPHLLSMTATPIPRTLALTVYGDLDLSLIDELPKGRKKITTEILSNEDREKTYSFVRKELKKGKQAFIVCPRIDSSNDDEEKKSKWFKAKAVKEEHEKLSKEVFKEFRVGLIHGKMKVKEKENAMKDFKNKKNDVLVSTSVIEVGIDVPNATIMIIEGAERFGLAQLHQLRGRVGRSKNQSYCFLFPETFSPKTKNRLHAVVSCHDGFALSEKDLELRGPGDFIGKRQWGMPDTVMKSLTDLKLVELAREAARSTLEDDFNLKKSPLIKKEINFYREKMYLE